MNKLTVAVAQMFWDTCSKEVKEHIDQIMVDNPFLYVHEVFQKTRETGEFEKFETLLLALASKEVLKN